MRSQKRRVQCLRNRELEAQNYSRPRTWHVKQTTDKGKPSTNFDLVFAQPTELRASSGCEQGKHKHLRSEIVKEDATSHGRQQLIKVVGFKNVS